VVALFLKYVPYVALQDIQFQSSRVLVSKFNVPMPTLAAIGNLQAAAMLLMGMALSEALICSIVLVTMCTYARYNEI
jgi:hypothetical protein